MGYVKEGKPRGSTMKEIMAMGEVGIRPSLMVRGRLP
jgi:hypothetical protein